MLRGILLVQRFAGKSYGLFTVLFFTMHYTAQLWICLCYMLLEGGNLNAFRAMDLISSVGVFRGEYGARLDRREGLPACSTPGGGSKNGSLYTARLK